MSIASVSLVAVTLIALSVAPTSVDEPPHNGIRESAGTSSDGKAYEVLGKWATQSGAASGVSDPASPTVKLVEYRHGPKCASMELIATTPMNAPCTDGQVDTEAAGCEGAAPVEPLWVRQRETEASPWGLWMWVAPGGCPAAALPVLTAEDFRRLPLAPPVLHLQPDRGWVLVNMDTIVSTDKAEQTFRTDLLGHGIDVVATPDTFTYDWGDGSALLVTHSAGHAYPNQDTFHAYTALGTRQITLTTTWTARYRVDGTTQWKDVVGTAATSATSAPFTVDERRSHLVAELCTVSPTPLDCAPG